MPISKVSVRKSPVFAGGLKGPTAHGSNALAHSAQGDLRAMADDYRLLQGGLQESSEFEVLKFPPIDESLGCLTRRNGSWSWRPRCG